MDPARIIELSFSPCGTTEAVAHAAAVKLSEKYNVKLEKIKFTALADRAEIKNFTEGDLLVVASPTYAGKIPNKIMPDFKEKIKSQGAKAVAIVTYGNRSFDNSLAELKAILKANGFAVVAGAAVVTEHSMVHIAAGKPTAEDLAKVAEFAGKIKMDSEPEVPGDADAPYYVPKLENGEPAKFLKAHPKTDTEKCIKCGVCAKGCPMGSISSEDFSEVSGVCIKCQACVTHCKQGAKYFDDEQLLSHIKMLQQNFADVKESYFFL